LVFFNEGVFGRGCESEIGRGVVMVGGDRGVMEVKVVCSDVCRVVPFRIFVSKGFYFIPKRFKTFTRVNVFEVTGYFF
jgi:hypothetical protein